MPDYKAMRAEGRSIGKRHGRATAKINQERARQERKIRMEQRYAALAQDKAAHQNELARSKYVQAQAGKAEEDQLIATAVGNGTMQPDGTYTQKHWDEQAKTKFFSQDRSLAEEKHFYDKLSSYAGRESSGASKGYSRRYRSGVAETNYQNALTHNTNVAEREGSREFLEGIDKSINRLGDKIFGSPEGSPEAPAQIQQPQGTQFGRNEEFTGTIDYEGKPTAGKLEDFQTVEALDADNNVITGRTYRMATDETTRQAYILKDGKWEEAKGEYQIVDKDKTGQGITKVNAFKSPLQSKEFIKKSGYEGRAVQSLGALFDTVSSKMANPKDFADRLFESLGNTLAAVAGYDGTEGEIVEQYLNATTSEEKEVIKKTMGFGVSDAIHKGQADQRELFATLHLARALAGTGKLSVNAMDAARKITNGGSDTSSLSKLEGSRKSMQKSLQRSIISQAGHHNIQLSSMKPSAEKDRVERTQGYPVFSSTDYRKQMQMLGYAPDKKVIDRLDHMFKSEVVFFNDEHGRTMAPAIVKYTTDQGEDAFTIGIRPQHYE